jgi:hypothetical protein
MRNLLRRWSPYLRTVLGLAVVALIAYHLAQDLRDPRLWERSLRPGWVVLSGVLYLTALFFSALTWRWLLARFGRPTQLLAAARAYYLGQVGKYLPGKAWALFVRADLIRGEGVPYGLGVVTSLYEVFLTMSGEGVLAVVLFALFAPDTGSEPHGQVLRGLFRLAVPAGATIGRTTCVLLALGLLAAVLGPALPPVFNRVARRVASPLTSRDEIPGLRWRHLGGGLLLTCAGALFAGASLGAAACSVVGTALPWTLPAIGRISAAMGVAYIAGFVILLAPSGLGVREYFITLFLTPDLVGLGLPAGEARGLAVLTALMLRVTWTAAELLAAAALWKLAAAPTAANPVS